MHQWIAWVLTVVHQLPIGECGSITWHTLQALGPSPPTQRDLLQQVNVAGEELVPQGVQQVEGHAVPTHAFVCLLPAVAERLVSGLVLNVQRRATVHLCNGNVHLDSLSVWVGWCVSSQCECLIGVVYVQSVCSLNGVVCVRSVSTGSSRAGGKTLLSVPLYQHCLSCCSICQAQ